MQETRGKLIDTDCAGGVALGWVGFDRRGRHSLVVVALVAVLDADDHVTDARPAQIVCDHGRADLNPRTQA